ncbi:hypothetical protein NIES4071_105560 (plasmid) [Calothrix sp. NIES-4071]|nr:hypothetical protein NIES4071_105560 [Calothrix sp. NIES-4071]BAZ64974.1 hypothetical protein NIES4105_107070 [Calothrix sp. NIES-4105]
MIYVGADSGEAFADTGLSYLLADARLKAIIREWITLRTVQYAEVSTGNGGWRASELKHQFQRDTGLYCFNGTMLGCILELGHKARKIKSSVPYIKTNLKLNRGKIRTNTYEFHQQERETVDNKKFYSALKHYVTKFECNVFKEHFGNGADTQSDMVDSWDRLEDLGAKIIGLGGYYSDVRCSIPDRYLSTIPNFITSWMPLTLHKETTTAK